MEIYKDIEAAIKVIDKNPGVKYRYRKVKIFPDYSLKHFKKFKLDNKQVLTNINCTDEILDLLTYKAKLTCFSTNRLYEYFLNLLLKAHLLNRKEYLKFLIDEKRNRLVFDKEIYDKFKNELDDKTREFFDEMYKYCSHKNTGIYKLVERPQYKFDTLQLYIRNYLNNRYGQVDENSSISFWNISQNEICETFKKESFDIINLSNQISSDSELEDINKYASLLKENGKILSYVSRDELQIENHEKLETRSLLDPYTKDNGETECKKDYAYVYRK